MIGPIQLLQSMLRMCMAHTFNEDSEKTFRGGKRMHLQGFMHFRFRAFCQIDRGLDIGGGGVPRVQVFQLWYSSEVRAEARHCERVRTEEPGGQTFGEITPRPNSCPWMMAGGVTPHFSPSQDLQRQSHSTAALADTWLQQTVTTFSQIPMG
jgi:hypothetical protein